MFYLLVWFRIIGWGWGVKVGFLFLKATWAESLRATLWCLPGREKSQCLKYWLDGHWRVHVDSIKSHLVLAKSPQLCTGGTFADLLPTPKANKQPSHADQGEVKLLLLAACSLFFDVKSLQNLGWRAHIHRHLHDSSFLFYAPFLCFSHPFFCSFHATNKE